MVSSWSVDARRRFLGALNAVCRIRVVQGAAGRSTWRLVDDHTATLEGAGAAGLALDDLVDSNGLLCVRLARRDGVCAIVADDRGHNPNWGLCLTPSLILLALQTQAILDGEEQAPHSDAVPWDLDQGGLAQLAVDDGLGLAVLAVKVLGHVDGVLVTTVTEGTVLLMDTQGVCALRAVARMALECGHDVFLVIFELADAQHGRDGLGALDQGGHGV